VRVGHPVRGEQADPGRAVRHRFSDRRLQLFREESMVFGVGLGRLFRGIRADEQAAEERTPVAERGDALLAHRPDPLRPLEIKIVVVHRVERVQVPLVPFLPDDLFSDGIRAGEYGSRDLLAFGVYLLCQAVHEAGDQVVAELFPRLNLRGILDRFDVDSGPRLEIGNTLVAIAIVELRIFAVHHKAVFLPEPTGEDDVRKTDEVQVDAIDLRDLRHPAVEIGQVEVDLLAVRAEKPVIANAGRLVVSGLAEAVHPVPFGLQLGIVLLDHRRDPGLELQASRLGDFPDASVGFGIMAARIEQAIYSFFLEVGKTGFEFLISRGSGTAQPGAAADLGGLLGRAAHCGENREYYGKNDVHDVRLDRRANLVRPTPDQIARLNYDLDGIIRFHLALLVNPT